MATYRYWRVGCTTWSEYAQAVALEFRETIGGADATGSGTALASSYDAGAPSAAFDRNASTYWSSGAAAEHWLGYDFGAPIQIMEIAWHTNPGSVTAPHTWWVDGSDDGTSWVTVALLPEQEPWTVDSVRVVSWQDSYIYEPPSVALAATVHAPGVSPRQIRAPAVGVLVSAAVPAVSPLQLRPGVVGVAVTPGSPSARIGVRAPTAGALALSLHVPRCRTAAYLSAASASIAVLAPSFAWIADPGLPPVYLLVLTGAEDGLADVTLPMSSFDARWRDGEASYLQAVVPDAYTYAAAIAARPNGSLVVRRGVRLANGTLQTAEIGRVHLELIGDDRGAHSASVSLSGHQTVSAASPKERSLSGVSYRHSGSGPRRFRCSADTFLRPGDTAVFPELADESVVVGSLSYSVSVGREVMEVAEADT